MQPRRAVSSCLRSLPHRNPSASASATLHRHFSSIESQRLLRPLRRPNLETLTKTPRNKLIPKRNITTEQKQTFVYQLKLGLYWSAIGWAILGGVAVSVYVLNQDLLDRQYPSPSEWHWIIRQIWRSAHEEIETEGRGRGAVEWTSAGTQLRSVVSMLEDFNFIYHRPSGCQLQTDFDRTIPGISEEEMRSDPPASRTGLAWPSRIGYDISMKSDRWRRGYFEALLLVAKASGYREGYMSHKITKDSYAPQHIRSPANPYPVPLPQTKDGKEARLPDIDECHPTFEPADFHFKRLLTTKGLSRAQRVEAAVAYASYLEQAGRGQLASDILDWALDRAAEGVTEPSRIVNTSTGVLRTDAPFVTPNILTAVTALAGLRARNDDIKRALPMYLSILRARQSAPEAPADRQYPYKAPDYSLNSGEDFLRWMQSLATTPEYPADNMSGDLPYERAKSAECEEAALMAHVGEILFARANLRGEGIEWSQRASNISKHRRDDKRLNARAKKTCEQCYATSLGNLNRMTALLAEEQKAGTQPGTAGWFGLNAKDRLLSETDWNAESQRLAAELLDMEEKRLRRRLDAAIKGQSSMFVV